MEHVQANAAVFIRSTGDELLIGSGRELYQAIVETTDCPICNQRAQSRCLTISGNRASRVHMSRFYRFWEGPEAPVMEDLTE